MRSVWNDSEPGDGQNGDGNGDAVAEQLARRLAELTAEAEQARTALLLRRLEAAQEAGELAGGALEVLQDALKGRDSLLAVLPDLVNAAAHFEPGDGLITESVPVVAEVIGRLDAAPQLLMGAEHH